MQFLYHFEAGKKSITLEGDSYRYIFKVRRLNANSPIYLRNLKDGVLYTYKVLSLNRRKASLVLVEERFFEIVPRKILHIGWCQIDPKSVEKVLPILNEMGVAKITFFPCQRSQRAFKCDFERLNRILINSSQQCGRSKMMELKECASLNSFLEQEPNSYLLNFSPNKIPNRSQESLSVVVGCEGGLTKKEESLFDDSHIFGLKTDMILRSESAVCAVASSQLFI